MSRTSNNHRLVTKEVSLISINILSATWLYPCDRYGWFYGVTDQSNPLLVLLVHHFGPIRVTIKSTVLAVGIEKMLRHSGNKFRMTQPGWSLTWTLDDDIIPGGIPIRHVEWPPLPIMPSHYFKMSQMNKKLSQNERVNTDWWNANAQYATLSLPV